MQNQLLASLRTNEVKVAPDSTGQLLRGALAGTMVFSLSLSVFLVRGLVFFFLCLSLSLTRQEGAPPQGTPVCWRYAKNYPHSPSDIPRGCLTTSAVVMTVDLALACVASTFAMQPSSAALETQKQYGNIMNTCKLYSAHWSVCEAVGQLIL